eukprot:scaffold31866_cov101-Isochrysis_galbana.AAC.1
MDGSWKKASLRTRGGARQGGAQKRRARLAAAPVEPDRPVVAAAEGLGNSSQLAVARVALAIVLMYACGTQHLQVEEAVAVLASVTPIELKCQLRIINTRSPGACRQQGGPRVHHDDHDRRRHCQAYSALAAAGTRPTRAESS